MPRGRLVVDQDPQIETLRTRLTREWEQPNDGVAQPVVIEAPGNRLYDSVHLYVIWDDWRLLEQRERSEIIMDAYAATHERQEVLSVTVAMGLTAAEAERMGIRYEAEVVA